MFVKELITYPVYTVPNDLDCDLDHNVDREALSCVNTQSGSG